MCEGVLRAHGPIPDAGYAAQRPADLSRHLHRRGRVHVSHSALASARPTLQRHSLYDGPPHLDDGAVRGALLADLGQAERSDRAQNRADVLARLLPRGLFFARDRRQRSAAVRLACDRRAGRRQSRRRAVLYRGRCSRRRARKGARLGRGRVRSRLRSGTARERTVTALWLEGPVLGCNRARGDEPVPDVVHAARSQAARANLERLRPFGDRAQGSAPCST